MSILLSYTRLAFHSPVNNGHEDADVHMLLVAWAQASLDPHPTPKKDKKKERITKEHV